MTSAFIIDPIKNFIHFGFLIFFSFYLPSLLDGLIQGITKKEESFLSKFDYPEKLYQIMFFSMYFFVSIICAYGIIFFVNAGFIFSFSNTIIFLISAYLLIYFNYKIFKPHLESLKVIQNLEQKPNTKEKVELNNLKVSYKKNFKKMLLYAIAPFLISLILFQVLLGGEKIYKINKFCKLIDKNMNVDCTLPNGTYVGGNKGFLRHGYGVYQWNSGSEYDGLWKNNLMHGQGKMTMPDGEIIHGTWNKHKLVKY